VAGRLLAAAVASLAAAGLFAALLIVSADTRRLNVAPDATSTLAHTLNRAHPPTLWPSWTVLQANSAHHALVVDVEARRVEQAREIAEQIVKPVRSRGYQEILIYVRPVNNPTGAMRRVQWTPRTGFVETAYGAVRE
jgi:ribosomal protein S18 acetylase RimI-like enzyme